MNRETIIEAMARAAHDASGLYSYNWDDNGPFDPNDPKERGSNRHGFYLEATAALAAIEAAGVRLVPSEPSRHMLVAAHMVERDDIELTEDEHRAMYAAFLSASPYATGDAP